MGKYSIYATKQDYEKAYAELKSLEGQLGISLDWVTIKVSSLDKLSVSIDILKRQLKFAEASKAKRVTPEGKSYWDKTGAYQKEYDELYERMAPSSGEALTLNGELIRAISRLGYEWCNNGNCNAADATYVENEDCQCCTCDGNGEIEGEECEDCEGSGFCCTDDNEEIEDSWVTPMYAKFLRLIVEAVPEMKPVTDQVERIILSQHTADMNDYFSAANYKVYNQLNDEVIFYVLNNEDKELPAWYGRDNGDNEPVEGSMPAEELSRPKVKLVDGKPSVRLVGADGNVFNLSAICIRGLEEAGQGDKVAEFKKRILASHSYDDALIIMMEYVDVN